MTFALTGFQAYGIEAEEAITKRYRQFLVLTITAANTDTDLDLDDYVAGSLGTFWDAVDGSEPGDSALKAIRDICARADQFLAIQSEALSAKSPNSSETTIDSGASTGGGASESLTFTGLLATDTVLGLTQRVAGGNNVAITSFGSPGADAMTVGWTGDPGAGNVVRAHIRRAAPVAPGVGQYSISIANKAPKVGFASGDAPTSAKYVLSWVLKPGHLPVEDYS